VTVSDRLTQDDRFLLTASDRELILDRIEQALRRARRSASATLATLTKPLPADVDPSAVVCASRRAGEPWFVFEQPERGRSALGALGEVCHLRSSGAQRFHEIAGRWRALASNAVSDPPDNPNAGAPAAIGGFSFAPDGGSSPQWGGFDEASLVVPEILLRREEHDGTLRVRLTLAVLAEPDDTAADLLGRVEHRLAELQERILPLLDPAPAGHFHIAGTMPPEHFEAAVSRAVEMIRAGELQKIVLAREVQVHAPADYNPAALLGVLRDAFPSCFTFCVGRGESTLIGSSPELLLRREGQRLSTLALAGSTRRSADPAVDDYLGERLMRDESYREEHAIVARRIERTLRSHALWVACAPEPTLVRIANIQHLATPIRAQLAGPIDAVELVGMMHPTPAVGGEPSQPALGLIPALEGLDRGWYAGPVGWTDATGDGEFCVALRCALLHKNVARCYAGNGIVRDSDPVSELAETEIKLQALLPLLAG
jgi:salicylate biosynthesis isochorismate synthase